MLHLSVLVPHSCISVLLFSSVHIRTVHFQVQAGCIQPGHDESSQTSSHQEERREETGQEDGRHQQNKGHAQPHKLITFLPPPPPFFGVGVHQHLYPPHTTRWKPRRQLRCLKSLWPLLRTQGNLARPLSEGPPLIPRRLPVSSCVISVGSILAALWVVYTVGPWYTACVCMLSCGSLSVMIFLSAKNQPRP